jgi:hypothetical protein
VKTNDQPDSLRPTRREFARTLAVLAAVPLVVEPAGADPVEDVRAVAAKNLSKIVELRYGKFLTPKQKKEVQRGIRSQLRAAERLHKVKLAKGDEPASIFRADVL